MSANRSRLHGIDVTILRSADGARAVVADHGAHVLSWQPAGGDEQLFLSPTSGFGAGQAIRGGVPVIFPQFGERGLGRRHGVARTQAWQFQRGWQEEGAALGEWQLRGMLERSRPDAPAVAASLANRFAFLLTLTVRLQAGGLSLALRIDNTGPEAWQCHAALHTYLQVAALAEVGIEGLQHHPFIDNATPQPAIAPAAQPAQPGSADCLSAGEPGILRFAGEIDRIYPDAPAQLLLADGQRRRLLRQEGFTDTVVWNPGAAKAAALADLAPGADAQFVCIEAAAVLQPISLAAGACWQGSQHLRA